jgi:Lrp/AsnC family transcriptional regulator, leucine-responsive regulatory protein
LLNSVFPRNILARMRRTSRAWDATDVRLLDLLQADADRTLRALGDEVGLSPSAVQRRITRYKRVGLLRTVGVVEAPPASSLVRALVMLTLAEETRDHHRRLTERLRARPEVQQCYALSGRWDYAVVVTAATIAALHELGNELFKDDENIRRYDTLFIFDAVKTGQAVSAAHLLPTLPG